jgi:alcohol dehydrogenase class IV
MPPALLRKFLIPEMIYGADARLAAGQLARRLALEKVLVVSDQGVCNAGIAGQVIDSLQQSGVAVSLFSDVTSNPKDFEVMAGARQFMQHDCNGIISVGGGSPMDCAKGIGIVCSNGGTILDYEGVDRIAIPIPPLICIPTTAGTAADISQFAIITNSVDQRKIAIISKSIVPDLALIDPLTTCSMDPMLTACTGLDALVHAIEAYVSTASSPFTDLQAHHAIELIAQHLLTAITEPDNLTARDGMMLASTEAGMAFSNASLGAVHAMAHSLGGLLNAAHGECNALLLEHVIRYNFKSSQARYRVVANLLGILLADDADLAAQQLAAGIRALRIAAGVSGNLADRGVSATHLPQLARFAMQDPCMVTNPRRLTTTDIEAMYAAAL